MSAQESSNEIGDLKMTNIRKFVNEMANQYTRSFNVYREDQVGDIPVDFYAEYKRTDDKYLITKTIKVWSVENQQYVFVKSFLKEITVDDVRSFSRAIDRNITKFIPEKQEHMSTYFVGVMITNQSLNPAILKEIKRSRRMKFLKFGIHGWADRMMAVVSLKDNCVYVHPKGKEFVSGFEEVLKKEEF